MPAISAGKFFGYVNPDPHLESFALFSIRVDGGESVRVVMDTGSNGIVLGSDLVKGGTVMDPQPPAPSYSSSGNSYEGQWVLASVELTGLDGETFTTANPVAVFAATNVQGVSMMGVSTRFPDAGDEFNVFLNLPEMVAGQYRKGYILTREGVWFGYGEAEIQTFRPLLPSTPAALAQAMVTLTPPTGSGLRPYTETAPFLLDTGIDYMIVTPPSGTLPPPGYQHAVGPHEQWISGVGVEVSLGGQPVWSFDTGEFGEPGKPAYGRFGIGKPPTAGIINTGRHLLEVYDYLADVESGQVGLRPAAPRES